MRRVRSGITTSAMPNCANPVLSYFGGPVLQQPTIHAVFWTLWVNATLQANIGQVHAQQDLPTIHQPRVRRLMGRRAQPVWLRASFLWLVALMVTRTRRRV